MYLFQFENQSPRRRSNMSSERKATFWPVADPEAVQVILGQMMIKGLFHL